MVHMIYQCWTTVYIYIYWIVWAQYGLKHVETRASIQCVLSTHQLVKSAQWIFPSTDSGIRWGLKNGFQPGRARPSGKRRNLHSCSFNWSWYTYIYIYTWKTVWTCFLSIMGFTRNGRFSCSIAYFGFWLWRVVQIHINTYILYIYTYRQCQAVSTHDSLVVWCLGVLECQGFRYRNSQPKEPVA